LRKFAAEVAPGGIILYGREQLPEDLSLPQAQVVCIPAPEIADKLGLAKVANIVMLGALLEETECLSPATAMNVLEAKVKNPTLLELDRCCGRRHSGRRVRAVGKLSGGGEVLDDSLRG
jgi:Pyruvate/2-oxoacid:ferredoxin oxidoreductase gamma subunit